MTINTPRLIYTVWKVYSRKKEFEIRLKQKKKQKKKTKKNEKSEHSLNNENPCLCQFSLYTTEEHAGIDKIKGLNSPEMTDSMRN